LQQGYKIGFTVTRSPTFFFSDPPYSCQWVMDFAAGIVAAAERRDDLVGPAQEASDARKRGERMGFQLLIFQRRWESKINFKALTVEWIAKGQPPRKVFYDRLGRLNVAGEPRG
jgi:hypothetical protein